MRIGPRQRGHSSTSIAKTRFISSGHASRLTLEASGLVAASALATGMADGLASSSHSGTDPSLSIEEESGAAEDAVLAGSPSTRDGVEADSGLEKD
jgi:hypothetical protein